MADPGRLLGAILPATATPEQAALNRRLLGAVQGLAGQSFGRSWRAVEAPYPSSSDPASLHFQVKTSSGWRSIIVISPDQGLVYIPLE